MTEQPTTTKEAYLAYLGGELSFEAVEQSVRDALTNHHRNRDSPRDIDQS